MAYMAFVVLAVALLALMLFRPEEARLWREQETILSNEARKLAAVTPLRSDGPRWGSTLARLARLAGVRVTLIDRAGRVIGDSSHDPGTMENHANRPEVRRALAGAIGCSRRYSRTLRADLLYAAVPLRAGGRVAGVLRVSRASRHVAAAVGQLRLTFAYGAILAVLTSLFFAAVVVHKITRPLRALERAARQLGAGDLETRVREYGQDELGLVARAFNRMAGQISRLVAQLGEESGKLQTVLAALADGIVVFDRGQRVILANRAAADFLGTTPEMMMGRSPAELLLPPPALALVASAAKERTTKEGEFEIHLPMHRRVAAILTPIRDNSLRLHGTLVVLRDLTALRHLERVRQDFVANVSHELRTPLTAIKAMAETLLSGGVDAEQSRRFLATINTECDRLNALVGDLLTLTRLDSRAQRPREEVFSLRALVRETADGLYSPDAPRRPVIDIPDTLPAVKADPNRIRQILINLLDNATKYTPPEAAFGVRAVPHEDQVVVSVWDDGPGIPPAERERIFERFYRMDKARSRALGGTGLGLSIVRHLVESYGGKVWVDGDRGAVFHFTVPRE